MRSGSLVEFAGQQARGEGAPGDDRHPQISGSLQYAIGLDIPVKQTVLHLVDGQRQTAFGQRSVRTAQLVDVEVAHPDEADLARLHQVGHGFHLSFGRGKAPRLVDHVQIDSIAVERTKAVVDGFAYIGRRPKERHPLGPDDDLVIGLSGGLERLGQGTF